MAEAHEDQLGKLRILHLEDCANDVVLIRANLEADGIECSIDAVETRAAFLEALGRDGYDVILSDFKMPDFDGLSALRLAMQHAPDVPFIFVSGALGEDAAILGVRSGARDYVLKQRLSRLGPAVRRAAGETQELRRRRRAEEALRLSEEQFRQAQKMEAVGRLAAGVAHDFNNLLTVILGYSQLMQTRLPEGDHTREEALEIQKAGERAVSLTRQLLAFSRQQVLQPRVLDLNAVVEDTSSMLRRLIGADVALVSSLAEGLGHVRADAGQIEQVVMNLAVNARDAMPSGGKLILETANVEIQSALATAWVQLPPGPYVLLSVSDTGCGMDAETMKKVFEPFFTTKEPGKGTGLGLATVHGIVHQSGGQIELYSEPGRGTTFKIYLPRVQAELQSSRPARAQILSLHGTETILVVEDEAQVRAIVRKALELNGYRTLEASDGLEALDLCTRGNARPDLVLVDVVMPRLNGPQLAARLTELRPNLKIVFMSGYTDQAVVHQGILDHDMAFLQKPFTREGLLGKVREVLDTPAELAA